MNVLVTAGATQVPIDKVRSISNIFKGRTGFEIAKYFTWPINHPQAWPDTLTAYPANSVTLITSNPDLVIEEMGGNCGFALEGYRTFDELVTLMEQHINGGHYDVIIHSAAVSDYRVSRVLDSNLKELDNSQKISSQHGKMYLELEPTIKIVDQIRKPWGFTGKLVKFKLQVGISDEELLAIAGKSRIASEADLIVANCLEWARERAYILGADRCETVARINLPEALYTRVTS